MFALHSGSRAAESLPRPPCFAPSPFDEARVIVRPSRQRRRRISSETSNQTDISETRIQTDPVKGEGTPGRELDAIPEHAMVPPRDPPAWEPSTRGSRFRPGTEVQPAHESGRPSEGGWARWSMGE